MGGGSVVEQLLEQVVQAWSDATVLPTLQQLVDEVWRVNLDRQEPELGDDAQVLGLQSSLNLRNRAVRVLGGRTGVRARVVNHALRIEHASRELRVSKAPWRTPGWDVHAMDWSLSDTRLEGARANSDAYATLAGTLFEGDSAGWPSPAALRHLHLVWLGDPVTGRTTSWLGFPRLGDNPWFAVCRLEKPATAGFVESDPEPELPPAYDELDVPPVPLALRRSSRPSLGTS